MARKRKNLVNLLALLRHPLNGRRRRKYRLKLMSVASEPGRAGAEGPPFTVPSLTRRIAPHISVVAMARNEASRAHDTMRHFCALFDRVVLIDHLSDDSTADIARGYDGVAGTQVVVLRGEDPGYYQSEYMSAVANALIAEGRTDWIFFLDFDEYLPFDDQSAFRQALVDVAMELVIHGHWLNLALVGPAGGALQEAEVVIGPSVSSFVKIALNARLAAPGVKVAQGNHAVRLSGRDDDEIGRRAFALLHVPIAGPEALRRKVSQGTKALQDTQGKPETQGFHWREIQSKIDRIAEDGALARELAINYGNSVIDIVRSYDKGRRTDRSRSRPRQSPMRSKASERHSTHACRSGLHPWDRRGAALLQMLWWRPQPTSRRRRQLHGWATSPSFSRLWRRCAHAAMWSWARMPALRSSQPASISVRTAPTVRRW